LREIPETRVRLVISRSIVALIIFSPLAAVAKEGVPFTPDWLIRLQKFMKRIGESPESEG